MSEQNGIDDAEVELTEWVVDNHPDECITSEPYLVTTLRILRKLSALPTEKELTDIMMEEWMATSKT